jgi:8-oxo-dGTP pyrophosphatase MutT (NUDIX family)
MGGAWVFPGGSVDDGDRSASAVKAVESAAGLRPWRAAALRELVEETGIWLLLSHIVATQQRPEGSAVFDAVLDRGDRFAGDSMHYFANWITPTPLPVRFDTRFFAAVVPSGVDAIVDGVEVVDAAWVRPADARDRAQTGRWEVAFPTRRVLEDLGAFDTAARLVEHVLAQRSVVAIQPRLSIVAGRLQILMPGDPGFDAAAEEEADPGFLEAAGKIVRSGAVPEVGRR